MRVAVLGASPKQDRFSNKAVRLLQEHGHTVIPINPGHKKIENLDAAGSLAALAPGSVDTLTMYVGPAISAKQTESILALHPSRVIFNPGSENPALERTLEGAGIEVVEDCTLVMLGAGIF